MLQQNENVASWDSLAHVDREIKAIARHCPPEKASWNVLKSLMTEAANFLRLQANETNLPISFGKIRALRQVHRVQRFNSHEGPEAVLITAPNGGFIIKLAKTQPVRERWSIAHEIGHTFFYDLNDKPHRRLLNWDSSGFLSNNEEIVCNIFASELLMPSDLIISELRNRSFSSGLEMVSYFCDTFFVSEEAVARKLLSSKFLRSTYVAIFKDATRRFLNENRKHRKFYGKGLDPRLRKSETNLLKMITDAIDDGAPMEDLADIGKMYSNTITLEVKKSRGEDYEQIIALVNFHSREVKSKRTVSKSLS